MALPWVFHGVPWSLHSAAFIVLVWRPHVTFMVTPWCLHGAFMDSHGAFMGLSCGFHGVFLDSRGGFTVLSWCFLDASMVFSWCCRGASMVLYHGASLVLSRTSVVPPWYFHELPWGLQGVVMECSWCLYGACMDSDGAFMVVCAL